MLLSNIGHSITSCVCLRCKCTHFCVYLGITMAYPSKTEFIVDIITTRLRIVMNWFAYNYHWSETIVIKVRDFLMVSAQIIVVDSLMDILCCSLL